MKKTRTAHENETIKRMRAACKNQLQLAVVILADLDIRLFLVGMSMIVAPLRRWYGDVNRFTKSSHVTGSSNRFAPTVSSSYLAQPSRTNVWSNRVAQPFRTGVSSNSLAQPFRLTVSPNRLVQSFRISV